jgi:hypothetical protein
LSRQALTLLFICDVAQNEAISNVRFPSEHGEFIPIGHRPMERVCGHFLKAVVATGLPNVSLPGLIVVMEELKAELTAEVEGAEVMVKQGSDVLMQVWKNNVSAHRRVYRNIMVSVIMDGWSEVSKHLLFNCFSLPLDSHLMFVTDLNVFSCNSGRSDVTTTIS